MVLNFLQNSIQGISLSRFFFRGLCVRDLDFGLLFTFLRVSVLQARRGGSPCLRGEYWFFG